MSEAPSEEQEHRHQQEEEEEEEEEDGEDGEVVEEALEDPTDKQQLAEEERRRRAEEDKFHCDLERQYILRLPPDIAAELRGRIRAQTKDQPQAVGLTVAFKTPREATVVVGGSGGGE
jgi:hypothetical protein